MTTILDFADPYRALICIGQDIAHVRKSIMTCLSAQNWMLASMDEEKSIWLYPVVGNHSVIAINEWAIPGWYSNNVVSVKSFAHPVLFREDKETKTIGIEDNAIVAMDSRPYVTRNKNSGEYQVTNGVTNYSLQVLRAQLTHIMATGGGHALWSLDSGVGALTFAKWIQEMVCRDLQLGADEALALYVYAGIYYMLQHEKKHLHEMDDMERLSLLRRVSDKQCLNINRIELVQSILDKYEYTFQSEHWDEVFGKHVTWSNEELGRLNHWQKAMHYVVASNRVKERFGGTHSDGAIYKSLAGSYFGDYAAEIIGVALEHPPTWFALMLMSVQNFSDRRWKVTEIAMNHAIKPRLEGCLKKLRSY